MRKILNLGLAATSVVAMASLSGCVPGDTSGREAPLYGTGEVCTPDDVGGIIACPGDPGPSSCPRIVQFCDPNNGGRATACTEIPCGTGLPTGDPGTGDGGAGCTHGAVRGCTTVDDRLGLQVCSASGVWMMCNPVGMAVDAAVPMPDAGTADCGGDTRIGTMCSVGLGACATNGTFVCDTATGVLSCDAMTPAPATETCDNVDNDCDGSVDEGVTVNCYTGPAGTAGIGACTLGTQTCSAGVFGACTGEVTPTTDTCGDGIDQDCNGADLNCTSCGGDPSVGMSCTVGLGECAATGTYMCSADVLSCSAMTSPAESESCDNLDEDCDGAIDEELYRSCYSGPPGTASVGICRAGYETCSAGAWGACVGEILPQAEVCGDGIDQDCNGADLPCVVCGGDSSIGMSCAVGLGACRRTGNFECMGGVVRCNAVAGVGTSETCDNVDNDCDGATDESVRRSCYTGPSGTEMQGICRMGNQTCAAGVFGACTGEVLPGTEVCGDGIDQDCSGSDLACGTCGMDPRVGTSCTTGRGACLRTGTYRCTGGVLDCSATAGSPAVETCNNVDDDCDGATDESVTRSCYPFADGAAGVGICRAGTQTCSAGVFGACGGAIGPAASEICGNGQDDDCDGAVDSDLECPVGGGSDAGMPMSDAGSGGLDAGVGGSDAGSGGSDAGSGGSSDAGSLPSTCSRSGTGVMTVTYDASWLAANGCTTSGARVIFWDQFGCAEYSSVGSLSITVDRLVSSGFYATTVICGGGTYYSWPAGAIGSIVNTQGVSSVLFNGVQLADSEAKICHDSLSDPGRSDPRFRRPMIPAHPALYGTCP